MGNNTNVARFQAGDSQLKLTARTPNRQYHPGGRPAGYRGAPHHPLLPGSEPLGERFRTHGLPVPEFKPIAGSNRSSALTKDPDGQWVELLVAPDAPAEVYKQIEIGLTVSNLAASRKFYREFVGLEELPPVEDPVFHVTKYPYRHGSTIVNLRSFDKPLPADTGSGGIQYVVSDVKAVETLAKPGRSPSSNLSAHCRAFRLQRYGWTIQTASPTISPRLSTRTAARQVTGRHAGAWPGQAGDQTSAMAGYGALPTPNILECCQCRNRLRDGSRRRHSGPEASRLVPRPPVVIVYAEGTGPDRMRFQRFSCSRSGRKTHEQCVPLCGDGWSGRRSPSALLRAGLAL